MLDILITINIIIFSLLLFYSINLKNLKNIVLLTILYIYHMIISLMFYLISFTRTSDAFNYYHRTLENLSQNNPINFSFGTKFIDSIVAFLIQYFDFSYFNTFLFFSSLGFLGIVILYYLLSQQKYISKYAVLILFVPGVHFWTSSIGKDSLIFLFLSLSLYALVKNRVFLLGLSLIFIFLIRPHIALMLTVAIVFSFMLKSNVRLTIKIVFSIILLIFLLIILQSVMQYVGIVSITNIFEYINQRQQYNLEGGSSIIISEMTIVEKFFMFWYRPLFEHITLNYLVVSIENLLYLGMTIYIIKNKKYIIWDYTTLAIVLYILFVTFILSNTIANFGIIVRQKIMLFPMFYYLFILVMHSRRNESLIYAK